MTASSWVLKPWQENNLRYFGVWRVALSGHFPDCMSSLPQRKPRAVELADQHNEKNYSNLSMYLLQRCAMDGKRVRKNKQGDTNSLSFRNLARLLIVD